MLLHADTFGFSQISTVDEEPCASVLRDNRTVDRV
jgi:hypothetical protein